MTKKRRRRKPGSPLSDLSRVLRRGRPGSWGGADAEECVITTRGLNVEVFRTTYEALASREWWVLFGFESEHTVLRVMKEIAAFADGEEEWTEWAVSVMGQTTGKREDTLVFLFLPKSSWDSKKMRNRLRRVDFARVPKNFSGDQDLIPLTYYYRNAMMEVIELIMRRGRNLANNPEGSQAAE